MNDAIDSLLQLIAKHNGIDDKARLAEIVSKEFGLTQDRSIYYCVDYAVRFSASSSRSFSNTVVSLSALQKYDDRPFIVCLVTPLRNFCFLANTTFLKKISHSSHELRENHIRGSFNGSDIVREFEGIANSEGNIERLYAIHASIGFDGNLRRLVETTNNISPSGTKYVVAEKECHNILNAPTRAIQFVSSADARTLKAELDDKVSKYTDEILLAALIENVNVRGRVIEHLIAGKDELLRQELLAAIRAGDRGLPHFRTENTLGDYQRSFDLFDTQTDVKTKILILNSNPKGYNLDKMLEFLAEGRSVFMFYFIGVNPDRTVKTILVSMFQKTLLASTILLRHWAGRNSRGVSQLEGRAINELLARPNGDVDKRASQEFLNRIMAL